jgi:hypothetical protein
MHNNVSNAAGPRNIVLNEYAGWLPNVRLGIMTATVYELRIVAEKDVKIVIGPNCDGAVRQDRSP